MMILGGRDAWSSSREVGSKLARRGRKGVLVRGLKAPKLGKRGEREEVGDKERKEKESGARRRKRKGKGRGQETRKMNATTRSMNERIHTRRKERRLGKARGRNAERKTRKK
jgi:hypothetical protein